MELTEQYVHVLKEIDASLPMTEPENVPNLFAEIPLELFGYLSLQEQDEYPNIRNFFPRMVNDEIQTAWTGSSGETLLRQSVAFVRTVFDFFEKTSGVNDFSKISLLDFGVGWGRLIRLFYKYIPETQIYGVDAWATSLQTCEDCNIRGNFAKIDDICTHIPFATKFDVIISFSVFTHLSKQAGMAALNAMRSVIRDDGVLILTIRPYNYWNYHFSNNEQKREESAQAHIKNGFSFIPHNRMPIDGEVTFGDTSISIDYISENWTDWKLVDSLINIEDSFQKVLFLKPI